MQLGNITVETTASRTELLTMLLWGKPACGKTVFAATAPGKKLWLQFDPNGTASLQRTDDILVADFSATKPAHMGNFKQGGIIEKDLAKLISEHSINTIVVDSLTSFGQLCLYYGIATGKANSGKFTSSIEAPGMTGYGIRTSMILDFCAMVQRVASDGACHMIFIAHDKDTPNESGGIAETTISLGGQGNTVLPAKISEIWMMEDTGRARYCYTRSYGVRKPMRTRMFTTGDVEKFTVSYDAEKRTGTTIADMYNAWKAAGFEKIPLPK